MTSAADKYELPAILTERLGSGTVLLYLAKKEAAADVAVGAEVVTAGVFEGEFVCDGEFVCAGECEL